MQIGYSALPAITRQKTYFLPQEIEKTCLGNLFSSAGNWQKDAQEISTGGSGAIVAHPESAHSVTKEWKHRQQISA